MGEPEGFAEYIAARRDALGRAGFLLTGDRHLAEDLVQATLVRLCPMSPVAPIPQTVMTGLCSSQPCTGCRHASAPS